MKEKKINSTTILIIIVSLLLILTIGYIVYETTKSTKLNEFDNNNPVVNEDANSSMMNIEELSIEDELVKELYEMSQYYNPTSCIGNSTYQFEYVKDIGDIVLVQDISDKDKLNLAIKYHSGDYDINEETSETYLSESQINYGLEKVFGKNYAFNKLNTKGNMGCAQYEYVSEKGKFVATYACGNVCYPSGEHILSQLVKATKVEEDIEIYQLIGYDIVYETENQDVFNRKLYKDVERKQLVDDNFEAHELIIKYLNQLPKYKYTFKKNAATGNYYFYSIERVN